MTHERYQPTPTEDELRGWAAYVPETTTSMRWSESAARAFDRFLTERDSRMRREGAVNALTNAAHDFDERFSRRTRSALLARAQSLAPIPEERP